MAPITALTSSKSKFIWTEKCQKAFETIKRVMSRQVLLAFPDFSKPFEIYCDASDNQLGLVIYAGKAIYSRKLTSAQRNYTTMERELLSIVGTCKEFCALLLGFPCVFDTNHKNLTFKSFDLARVTIEDYC